MHTLSLWLLGFLLSPLLFGQLLLVKSWTYPLKEISGMYVWPGQSEGWREVVLLGDHNSQIGRLSIHVQKQDLKPHPTLDVSSKIQQAFGGLPKTLPEGKLPNLRHAKLLKLVTSQWEAVQGDDQGRVYLLHEPLQCVVVLKPGWEEAEEIIRLHGLQNPETPHKRNDLGEGFVLLSKNHMFVLKERNPSMIGEFAPLHTLPSGYNDRPVTPSMIRSEPPAKTALADLFLVKRWTLPKALSHCDLSELQRGPQGWLYVMSEECRWLGEIPSLKVEEDQVTFSRLWAFPPQLKKLEGFGFLDDQHILVALDQHSLTTPNLHLLKFQHPVGKGKETSPIND